MYLIIKIILRKKQTDSQIKRCSAHLSDRQSALEHFRFRNPARHSSAFNVFPSDSQLASISQLAKDDNLTPLRFTAH